MIFMSKFKDIQIEKKKIEEVLLSKISERSLKKREFISSWFIGELNENNEIFMSQIQMAKKSGKSVGVVSKTIGLLKKEGFILSEERKYYKINPDIIKK